MKFGTTIEAKPGETLAFGEVRKPGAYVSTTGGHLFRFTNEAFGLDGTPTLNMVSSTPEYLTQISGDPFLAVTKARILASDLDLPVNF